MNAELTAKTEIRELINDYAMLLDTDHRDGSHNDEMAAFFTDDAKLYGLLWQAEGTAEIRERLEARPADQRTRTFLSTCHIVLTSPTDATARVYVHAYHGKGDEPPFTMRSSYPADPGVGEWRLGLRKTEDGWRICLYEAVGPTFIQ